MASVMDVYRRCAGVAEEVPFQKWSMIWSRLMPVSERRQDSRVRTLAFGLVVLIFVYATSANIIEQPDRVRIALFFVCEIVVTSLVSQVYRSMELRQESVYPAR